MALERVFLLFFTVGYCLTYSRARFGSNPDHNELGSSVLSSEIGSLSLEFTRLSQLSGDPKFFDAIQRIANLFEQQQSLTKLSGTWPKLINAKAGDFSGDGDFTLGTLHDILPKVWDRYPTIL
jgi:mannosyl-oligosaccharide alpha-1,2-mannosidase